MKKFTTYRTLTVAIGILVAVVIAVTLLIRTPEERSITPAPSRPQATLPAGAKKLIDTTLQLFSQLTAKSQ